jgi:hypothetical protein
MLKIFSYLPSRTRPSPGPTASTPFEARRCAGTGPCRPRSRLSGWWLLFSFLLVLVVRKVFFIARSLARSLALREKKKISPLLTNPRRDHRRVRPARQHQVRVPPPDVVRGLQDAVVARGARGGDGIIRSHESQVHREQRAGHVGDREGDAERVHPAEPLRGLVLDGGREGLHAAHGRAHQDAAPVQHQPGPSVDLARLLKVDRRSLQRLLARDQSVLDHGVHPARVLLRDVVAAVEGGLDLAGETRGVVGGVPAGDLGDARLALDVLKFFFSRSIVRVFFIMWYEGVSFEAF